MTENMNKLVQALPDVEQIGIYHRKTAPSIINDSILKLYQKLITVLSLNATFPLVMFTHLKIVLILNMH